MNEMYQKQMSYQLTVLLIHMAHSFRTTVTSYNVSRYCKGTHFSPKVAWAW